MEVVHGEWIECKGTIVKFYKCNKCGVYHEYKTNFCPHCGADMRGGKNDC